MLSGGWEDAWASNQPEQAERGAHQIGVDQDSRGGGESGGERRSKEGQKAQSE